MKGIKMNSALTALGPVVLPEFSGVRCQMMPFRVDDPNATVHLTSWLPLVVQVCNIAGESGVGFLTVDEAAVKRGEHHRRPGLHVDCGGPIVAHGGSPPPGHGGSPPAPRPNHGGSGGGGGMYFVASHLGSRGWVGSLDANQGDDGDCSRLARSLRVGRFVELLPSVLYWANSTFIHETLPADGDQFRQFLRVSMPSAAPWHSDYTPSPFGVLPAGPVVAPRPAQMSPRAA